MEQLFQEVSPVNLREQETGERDEDYGGVGVFRPAAVPAATVGSSCETSPSKLNR